MRTQVLAGFHPIADSRPSTSWRELMTLASIFGIKPRQVTNGAKRLNAGAVDARLLEDEHSKTVYSRR